MAYWELEAGKCPQCGGPEGECSDPDRTWYPQMTVCISTMERQAANDTFDRVHEKRKKLFHDGTRTSWSKESDDAHPYHYRAGVTIWVSPQDHGLGGDFLSP